MKVEQIYTKCLAQGSYYIESNGEAAVIDPLRDVSHYLDLAKKSKSKIKYVFETHFHADFISGHLTLSNLTGAKIVFGPKADPSYPAIIAEDNQVFEFGDISLTALHTPGHTLESTSYLLKDNNGTEQAIFTGDTLFLGDVGIPDVAQRYRGLSKEDLAGTLYDSVNTKIKPLSDNILVYPAHGAGSACGKNMMKETVDTLKNQKKINYALNGSFTKQGFIEKLTDNLPEPPSYFPHNVRMNQQGYDDLSKIIKKSNKPLSVYEFENLANDKKIKIVDVRHQDEFAKGHVPNSIFIGLDGGFAPWVGSVLSDVQQPILLVVDDGRVEEAITRLSRVGFDNVKGFLRGGFNSWVKANKKVEKIETILATEFENNLNINSSNVFDVRKLTEYQSEHVLNSINIPLNNISNFISDFKKEGSHYIHCAGGYRSMIANSILKQHGIHNLTDIVGGFSSIKKTKIETTEYICPTTL
jgi:glyoxylase-like metal-dependent hydrolase (beta-lactamase superfamily II)/rhodanese-related sulfurtransferase